MSIKNKGSKDLSEITRVRWVLEELEAEVSGEHDI
jgi:hypothetical protein